MPPDSMQVNAEQDAECGLHTLCKLGQHYQALPLTSGTSYIIILIYEWYSDVKLLTLMD